MNEPTPTETHVTLRRPGMRDWYRLVVPLGDRLGQHKEPEEAAEGASP